MKFFIDTANIEEIKEALKLGMVDGVTTNPSLIANFIYELVKEYNQFYHDYSILKEENRDSRDLRLVLSLVVARVIRSGMELLGIEVPERM